MLKPSAGRRFEHFFFEDKFILRIMRMPDMPKASAGRRFEHVSYFGVELVAAYHMHTDLPKPSAGRRFEHLPYFGVKLVVAHHMHTDTPKPSACRRFEHCSYFGVKLFCRLSYARVHSQNNPWIGFWNSCFI